MKTQPDGRGGISWKKYIEKTSTNKPRALLVEALPYVGSREAVLDLGAGALVDSKYLLSQGFKKVIAVDDDLAAEEKSQEIKDTHFSFVKTKFENYTYPPETYDLINGQYAFSFIQPDQFFDVMSDVFGSLKKNGIITGQIFGDRDGWNVSGSGKSFLTRQQFDKLFSTFSIIKIHEEEKDDKTALGKPKHWHLFHFIAKK